MHYLLMSLFLMSSLGGCIFVPVIESVKEMGITKDQRTEQLPKVVKGFNDDVYWNNTSQMQALFDTDLSRESRLALVKPKKNQKIVSTEIEVQDLNPDATEAKVEVVRKRFSNNTLVVEECPEDQLWIFRAGRGWRLNELGIKPCS